MILINIQALGGPSNQLGRNSKKVGENSKSMGGNSKAHKQLFSLAEVVVG
jgi:hypothetical protein